MRFRLEFPDPRVVCRIEASGAADLLFGILDRITIDLPMLRPPDQKPTGEVVVRLSVKHTHPRCEVYLDVWRGVLPTEPARLGEYLEGEADDCPSRAESLWLRAVTVRLDEIRKGTVPGPPGVRGMNHDPAAAAGYLPLENALERRRDMG